MLAMIAKAAAVCRGTKAACLEPSYWCCASTSCRWPPRCSPRRRRKRRLGKRLDATQRRLVSTFIQQPESYFDAAPTFKQSYAPQLVSYPDS